MVLIQYTVRPCESHFKKTLSPENLDLCAMHCLIDRIHQRQFRTVKSHVSSNRVYKIWYFPVTVPLGFSTC